MRICHPSQLNARVQTARPPRISTATFIPSTRHIYVPRPVQYRTSLCLASSSSVCRLVCDFCSSGREFASSFFQIPPRGGHPCSSLTVPTAKSVVDFHHQVVVHAAHTKKAENGWGRVLRFSCIFYFAYSNVRSPALTAFWRTYSTREAMSIFVISWMIVSICLS